MTRSISKHKSIFGTFAGTAIAITTVFSATAPVFGLSIEIQPWSVQGNDSNAVLTDCDNADCSPGITMRCLAPGQPALVRFPALGTAKSMPTINNEMVFDITLKEIGNSNITTIGEARFIREIEIVLDENNRYVPQFFMAPNDPMLAQLVQLGDLEVVLNERVGFISLFGSTPSLDEFAELCSWPTIARSSRWDSPQPPAPQNGLQAVKASLSCQHPTTLDGQIIQMQLADDQSGAAVLNLPSFTANGRSFSPPQLGSWERDGTVFVDRVAIEAGQPSDWQVMMSQMRNDEGSSVARMEIDVPDYGVIECTAQIIR